MKMNTHTPPNCGGPPRGVRSPGLKKPSAQPVNQEHPGLFSTQYGVGAGDSQPHTLLPWQTCPRLQSAPLRQATGEPEIALWGQTDLWSRILATTLAG